MAGRLLISAYFKNSTIYCIGNVVNIHRTMNASFVRPTWPNKISVSVCVDQRLISFNSLLKLIAYLKCVNGGFPIGKTLKPISNNLL